mgnify:CR=1 FL=1
MEEKLTYNLKKWEAAEALFVAGFGTFWHFVYEWSGENFLLGLIAPVNESVFEHLKLLLVPVFLFTLIEFIYLTKLRGCLLWRKWQSMMAGIAFIAAFYYCYTGILQRDVAWLDVGSFYAAAVLNSLLAYRLLQAPCKKERGLIGCLAWAASIFLMVLGTLYPPVEMLPGLFLSP